MIETLIRPALGTAEWRYEFLMMPYPAEAKLVGMAFDTYYTNEGIQGSWPFQPDNSGDDFVGLTGLGREVVEPLWRMLMAEGWFRL